MEDKNEFSFEGVEFDQRDYERKTFAKGYNTLNAFESKMYGEDKRKFIRKYVAQLRTLINIIFKYIEDDELQELALEVRDQAAKELNNMRKAQNYRPKVETLDSFRDALEDFRFDANFNIPRKKRSNPETAAVDQL